MCADSFSLKKCGLKNYFDVGVDFDMENASKTSSSSFKTFVKAKI